MKLSNNIPDKQNKSFLSKLDSTLEIKNDITDKKVPLDIPKDDVNYVGTPLANVVNVVRYVHNTIVDHPNKVKENAEKSTLNKNLSELKDTWTKKAN